MSLMLSMALSPPLHDFLSLHTSLPSKEIQGRELTQTSFIWTLMTFWNVFTYTFILVLYYLNFCYKIILESKDPGFIYNETPNI